ncbi:helix-turn-helix transcriptional regulator [Pseudomonas sp. LFM046]|uniref:ArsR/SmtB family transcription factor n=1 Tax=Pseudomonas sp. LFM046 TaxID=1608357 RepID=UPI0005CFA111|nr:helix-turn-helix transcriptional regulator [Pseudomonas sp. LFM046]
MDDIADLNLSAVAGAIADPARARMLCSLLDGHARTATELSALADISASAASAHFTRLRDQGLVEMLVQGRHRYYRLANGRVAAALEALLVVADRPRPTFRPSTPSTLRYARTCYDHCAGELAVKLHDAILALGWIEADGKDYRLTEAGAEGFKALGLNLEDLYVRRRRLAFPCMDWSQRTPHLGGALGALLLELMVRRGWVTKELDSRALRLTPKGAATLHKRFGFEARMPVDTHAGRRASA